MCVVNAHVSVTYQTDNSKLLKQLHFWLIFWSLRKWLFVAIFHVTKIPELSSEGRKMLSHDNGEKVWLLKEWVSRIFDVLALVKLEKKKEGWSFFYNKPNYLRLAEKNPDPWVVLARNLYKFFSEFWYIFFNASCLGVDGGQRVSQ